MSNNLKAIRQFNLSQNLETARRRLELARSRREAAEENAQFWSNEINLIKKAAYNEGIDPNDL